jgi:prepilin-type N-terminal cleavage/methylation domain-containing protein
MLVTARRLIPRSQGFTLIELLVVITILASLLILAFINGPRYITKANDATRKSDLEA